MKPIEIKTLSDLAKSSNKKHQKAALEAIKAAEKMQKKMGLKLKPAQMTMVVVSTAYEKRLAEDGALRAKPPREPHPKAVIKTILQDHLGSYLKAKGFRKKGRHFWRVQGDIVDVIDLQSSQYNDAWESKFTINLHVGWLPFQRLIGGLFAIEPMPPKVCIFRHRLTPDMEKRADLWWHVRSDTDVVQLAQDLLGLFDRTGFPWMESKHDSVLMGKEVASRWPSHIKELEQCLRNEKQKSTSVPKDKAR